MITILPWHFAVFALVLIIGVGILNYFLVKWRIRAERCRLKTELQAEVLEEMRKHQKVINNYTSAFRDLRNALSGLRESLDLFIQASKFK
jgi:hypothetical protein